MSESLASHLKLPRYSQHIIVEGAYSGGNSKHFVHAMLQSLDDPSQSVTLKFSVIPKLKTSQSPRCKHEILNEPSLKNLKLADPDLGGHWSLYQKMRRPRYHQASCLLSSSSRSI